MPSICADFSSSSLHRLAGLMDEVSLKVNDTTYLFILNSLIPDPQTYEALAHHVTQANMNRRIKAVSMWSLQMIASAALTTLRNVADPLSAAIKEAYANRIREAYANGDANGRVFSAFHDAAQMMATPVTYQ